MTPGQIITPEEYLEQERKSETWHELVDGMVVARPVSNYWHVIIAGNIAAEFGNRLRRSSFRALVFGLRVHIENTGAFVYPDALICGEPRLLDGWCDNLLNPVVVFEVVSPATMDYDHGTKRAHYRRLESLTDYVLVSQEQPLVEVYTRHEDVWIYTEIADLDGTLNLSSVGAAVTLAEIYDGVTFPTDPPSR